jgi:hypothetical protein
MRQFVVSWFPDAGIGTGKPAYGDPETMTWQHFTEVFWLRRIGLKDGSAFVPSRFIPEPGSRQVRRKAKNVAARTLVALDLEPDKETGEIPSAPEDALARAEQEGLAALVYTSHSHTPDMPRYRIVLPLSADIPPEIPAPLIVARWLALDGVLDRSKLGASSLFYAPSATDEDAPHYCATCAGKPLDAALIRSEGQAILDAESDQANRRAAKREAETAQRRAEALAVGHDPDASLIERIRPFLDLKSVLLDHGYEQIGERFKNPNSSSGMAGATIKNFGGIDRVYSHNASDALHPDNLPEWCGVTAVDAFDAIAILDFGGDRKAALRALAENFNLTKTEERKALSKVIFRMVRDQASQHDIETQAFSEGTRLGLSHDEICRVAQWVADECVRRAA